MIYTIVFDTNEPRRDLIVDAATCEFTDGCLCFFRRLEVISDELCGVDLQLVVPLAKVSFVECGNAPEGASEAERLRS
jgi:hypothetical protein